jgi:hypothetical protein
VTHRRIKNQRLAATGYYYRATAGVSRDDPVRLC